MIAVMAAHKNQARMDLLGCARQEPSAGYSTFSYGTTFCGLWFQGFFRKQEPVLPIASGSTTTTMYHFSNVHLGLVYQSHLKGEGA
jgi:hypothetical protein